MDLIKWDDPDIGVDEINSAIRSLESGIGAKGANIAALEREFESYIGCDHAILTSNGTTALLTSLIALKELHGVRKIAVPSFTFIASANTAKFVVGDVTLVDCDPKTWNVRPSDVSDVDSLMLVDVGGVPCDYDEFENLGLLLLADSAESLGSTYKGNLIGTQTNLHCFSFQRSKIITCGEGGLITTNNPKLAALCRGIINHGYSPTNKSHQYIHTQFGLNFRMCDIEAAILRVQLRKLNKYLTRRKEVADRYSESFKSKFEIQSTTPNSTSNNFFYGILVNPLIRDRFAEYLLNSGILVKCWTSVHQQVSWETELVNSSRISDSIILLPIHNKLTNEQVDYIINTCLSF